RPSAVFAGALDAAHREARAHWRRWRGLEVGRGYEGLLLEVERPEEANQAILLAARGLRAGGTLVAVGLAPGAPYPRLDEAEILVADDLASGRRLLEARHPEGRLAHLPDPLRTLLLPSRE